mgnify:FL=1
MLGIVKSISRVSGVDININYGPSRENEYIRQVADISKAKKYLDWHPKITSIDVMCESIYEIERNTC